MGLCNFCTNLCSGHLVTLAVSGIFYVVSEALGKEFLISFVANTITLDSAKKAPNVQLQLLMKSKH